MTRIEFTHSYNGQDTWVFQMDPAVALNGTCGYRVRYDSGKQWTECVLRKAPRGSQPDATAAARDQSGAAFQSLRHRTSFVRPSYQ